MLLGLQLFVGTSELPNFRIHGCGSGGVVDRLGNSVSFGQWPPQAEHSGKDCDQLGAWFFLLLRHNMCDEFHALHQQQGT